MGAIEDVRKVIQDLVAPELKSLQVQIKAAEDASKFRDEASKLRDEALSEKIDRKFELVMAEMKANQAMLIYSMNIEKRVEVIERKTADPARAS